MCGNDVSARIWQSKLGGSQWCRGKAIRLPAGPVLVTRDELTDPNALAIKSMLNGEVMQSSNTKDMIFDVLDAHQFSRKTPRCSPHRRHGLGATKVLKPGDTIAIGSKGWAGSKTRS